ncbi:hypothetical protein [Streptomyces sp. NPDC005486]|uniref:hypothetical protein n=1 Tax=Streptomyces sp. NPDC005486 TaxID=3155345 RepID=UPI0033A10A49
MSAQSSDTVTVTALHTAVSAQSQEIPAADAAVPSAISVNVALGAAIGIFTGRLGSYGGADLDESAATRAERYTALAWRHPALLPE